MQIRTLLLLLAIVGLALAQPPSVATVINGASFQPGQPITGGSLVSVFGSQLASGIASADTIPLSNTVGGVSVTFVDGSTSQNCPMLYVQSNQINCQAPWNLVANGATKTVSVVVTRDGVNSQPAPVTFGPFSPGIFAASGLAVVVNPDGSYAWPVGAIPGAFSHPAKIGDVVVLYATGLGAVDGPVQDGAIPPAGPVRNTLTKPVILVGGLQADVQFSGLNPGFVGLNQVNMVVPNVVPNDKVPIQIQIGGITTPNSVTIAVMK